jgi:hypothetical protein
MSADLVMAVAFRLDLRPALRLPAIPSRGTHQVNDFWHFKPHFVFDDFAKRNIRNAEIFNVGNHRPRCASVAGIELAHPPGNHVHKHMSANDFVEGLFYEFRIHLFIYVLGGLKILARDARQV